MKNNLTQARIKELLIYNPETGVFTWRVGKGNIVANSVAGAEHSKGYIHITIDGKKYYAHRLAWLYMHNYWPSRLDHVNRLKSDNRIQNLREVSNSENQQNRLTPRHNTSGFKGVTWNSQKSKWWARISINCKKFHIGFFETPEEASTAYLEAVKSLHTHAPVEIS